jgi:hypothetical protein
MRRGEGAVRRTLAGRRLDVAIAAALALVVLGGATLLLGPGRARIVHTQDRLRELRERAAGWERERVAFADPNAAERAARQGRWEDLRRRVAPVDGPAALIARVAEALQAPSVRSLDVDLREAAPDAAPPEIALESPEGEASMALAAVPLEAEFRASPDDAARLLERIEQRRVPARLDSLDMKREPPGVMVHLGLTWFVRSPPEGAR